MYDYDVFISYKRGRLREEWLNTIFRPHFEEQLEEAIGKKPTIFIDSIDIPPGVEWPDYLATALSKSRCMVAILSPSYFGSEWCLKEFKAMYFRQNELRKKNLLAKDRAVILPFVKQGPMDAFPDFIDRIQLLDYSRFNIVGEGFKNTTLYVEMQQKIQLDARKTATMIKDAPNWIPEFEQVSWLNEADINLGQAILVQAKPSF